jgi:hypothetical protein
VFIAGGVQRPSSLPRLRQRRRLPTHRSDHRFLRSFS